jgi:hypothetical protein
MPGMSISSHLRIDAEMASEQLALKVTAVEEKEIEYST